MANYAVRIYDPEIRVWLIAEAARRGTGVRTSDIVEAALRCYQAHVVDEGAFDGARERISETHERTTGRRHRPVRDLDSLGGDVPRLADDGALDLSARETTPLGVGGRGGHNHGRASGDLAVRQIAEVNALTSRAVERSDAVEAVRAVDPAASMVIDPVLEDPAFVPVPRVKGPDSGPDDELGF